MPADQHFALASQPCLPAECGGNGSRNPSVRPSIHPSESRRPSTLSLSLSLSRPPLALGLSHRHRRAPQSQPPFGTFPRPLPSYVGLLRAPSLALALALSLSFLGLVGSSIIAPWPRRSVTLPPHHRRIRLAPTLEPIQSTRTRQSAPSLALLGCFHITPLVGSSVARASSTPSEQHRHSGPRRHHPKI